MSLPVVALGYMALLIFGLQLTVSVLPVQKLIQEVIINSEYEGPISLYEEKFPQNSCCIEPFFKMIRYSKRTANVFAFSLWSYM